MPEEKRTYESATVNVEKIRLQPRPGRKDETNLPTSLGDGQPHDLICLGTQVSRDMVLRLIGVLKES